MVLRFKLLLVLSVILSMSLYADDDSSLNPAALICSPQSAVSGLRDVAVTFVSIQDCYNPNSNSEISHEPEHANNDSLDKDVAMCKCLREKADKFLGFKSLFKPIQTLGNDGDPQVMLKNYEDRASHFIDRIKQNRNSLSFQASVIFEGNGDMVNGYRSEVVDGMFGGKESKLGRLSQEIDMKGSSEVKNGVKNILSKLNKPIVEVESEKLVREVKFDPKQCVGGREFLAFKQLPSPEVISELRLSPTFDEKEWDMKALRDKLHSMNGAGDVEKKKELKEKINFLLKNPMIKTVMSAITDGLDEEKKALRLKNKNDLFNILQSSAGKDKCKGPCTLAEMGTLIETGLVDYKDKLKEFFSTKEIIDATREAMDEQILADYDQLKSEYNFHTYRVEASHSAFVTDFCRTTNKDPEDCMKPERAKDIKECAPVFASYCQRLDTVKLKEKVGKPQDKERTDEDVYAQNNFEPDMNKNLKLKKFNEEICHTKRGKAGGPSLTFFEYKEQYCRKNASKSMCKNNSPENIQKIRTMYLDEYDKESLFNKVAKVDPTENVSEEESEQFAKKDPARTYVDWDKVARENNFGGDKSSYGKLPQSSSATKVVSSGSSTAPAASQSPLAFAEQHVFSNSDSSVPSSGAKVSGTPKIENMAKEEQENLLSGWENKMENLQKSKGKDTSVSPTEAKMKAEIEALKQLLANQKKLTDEQYKILNNAVAAQSEAEDTEKVSQSRKTETRKKSFSPSPINIPEYNAVQRGPASIRDQQRTNSNSVAASASLGARSSGSNASASKDAIAREMTKLANMQENSNGSITITSTGETTTAGANAIVIVVDEKVYSSAQANPDGLLSQISIPEGQIKEVGDYFVLLLQNGSKTLEVKVKKEAGGLQLQGDKPKQRYVSLDSLSNTFK
jgi:hypothetical protein